MQSQSWVFLKFSFFSPVLQFSFLLSILLHLSFINVLSLSFFVSHIYGKKLPSQTFMTNLPFLSLTEILQVLLSVLIFILFSASFLLFFFFYSGFLSFVTRHSIIFKSLSLSPTQVIFLVPLCLSSPVGELSSLFSLSHRPNPALPPALLASTGGYQLLKILGKQGRKDSKAR